MGDVHVLHGGRLKFPRSVKNTYLHIIAAGGQRVVDLQVNENE